MKKKSLPMQMSDKDNLRKNFSITERLNLNELDRQLINCKSSPISYHQFYQIARSIVEINFDENQINNENCQVCFTKFLPFDFELIKIAII